MNSNRKLYLLFPVLVFAAAFGFDKLFYIADVEDLFLRTASFINYDHKEDLLDELEEYLRQPQRRRVMVMFGNSRTMSFDNAYIESKSPDWILFNFSVPGGNSDYYAYFMERFAARGVRPDMIYFAVSPQGYNEAPKVAMDEVMLNGLSLGFVVRNYQRFSVSDLSNYAAKKLFWNYQYRPKVSVALKKLQNNWKHLRGFRQLRVWSYYQLLMGRGSVLYATEADARPKQDLDFLEKTAESTWRDFFSTYRQSEDMFVFTERFLAIAQSMQVPVGLVWAKVGPPLREMKNTRQVGTDARGRPLTVRQMWEPRMRKLAGKYSATFLDMNYSPAIKCDLFYDASHLAGACFRDFADYLLSHASKQ